MTSFSVAVITLGLALAIGLGIQSGFTVISIVILVLMVAVALMAVAVIKKGRAGGVGPAHCEECGGVISPNAPYCKHCGARAVSS